MQQGWIGCGLLGDCIIAFNLLEDLEDICDLHGIANDDTVLGCLIETLALLGIQASDQP